MINHFCPPPSIHKRCRQDSNSGAAIFVLDVRGTLGQISEQRFASLICNPAAHLFGFSRLIQQWDARAVNSALGLKRPSP